MSVLVAYASRHGATAGIAEKIAESLSENGAEAVAIDVNDVDDVAQYDAFVIGAAAYMFHWLKDATRFVKRNVQTFSAKPVWLFSSGPIGTELVDDEGRDVFEASRPKEFDELGPLVNPKGEKVFFGAWNPEESKPVGMAERFMKLLPASDSLPTGDFRDWEAIDAWAKEIADQLTAD